MQTPTPGAAVLFQPQHPDTAPHRDVPLHAEIVTVHTDRLVDIRGAETDGAEFVGVRVMLLQDEDDAPISGGFAYWPGAEHQASPVRDPAKAPEPAQDAVQAAEAAINHDEVVKAAATAATVRAEHAAAEDGKPPILSEADADADLAGTPRPDHPSV